MSVGLDNPEFRQMADGVKSVTSKPSNDTPLKLYAYFKQATVGDNNTDSPGLFELTQKEKWKAWAELKGMEQTDATLRYIELAKEVIARQ